jgi:hypothetical protein
VTACDPDGLLELRARMSLISSYIDVLLRSRPTDVVVPPAVVDDYLERAQLQAASIDAVIASMLEAFAPQAAPHPGAIMRHAVPIEIEGGPHD